jgi:hypothetical protein
VVAGRLDLDRRLSQPVGVFALALFAGDCLRRTVTYIL